MIDRLAVTADEIERLHSDPVAPAGFEYGIRVQLAQQEVEPRNFGRRRGVVRDREDRVADFSGIGRRMKCDGVDAAALNVDDRDVNSVERCAAHDAGYSQERFSSSCSSLSSRSASM